MSLLLLKLPRGFPFTQNEISHFAVTLPCVICITQPEPVLELMYHFPYQILARHFSLWFLSGLCDSSQILHLGALLRMCRGSYWGCAVPNRCLAMAPCTNLLKVTIFPLLSVCWVVLPAPIKENCSSVSLGSLSCRVISAY